MTESTKPASTVALRFSARDLLNVAIFAVIYTVVVYAMSMLGIISPLVMLVALPLSIIVAGVPYMLFLTRVKHAGMVTLFAVALALFYLIGGHPWISTALTVAVALVAEAVLAVGKYRSKAAAVWAYAVFSLWYIGPLLPLLMNREEYLSAPAMQAMGPEYLEGFDQTVTVAAVWVYNGSTFVCGLLGGLLGAAVLRKHFRKAGLA
ncbi:MAG: MptD family putative ECF transporter S component [Propionibacteriaceae bacterium]|jgi:energy-coupling factor transport system substrate-specific component|nr:MptD family putative ECF transporter S component [Propionibacteriaceae bacterium]